MHNKLHLRPHRIVAAVQIGLHLQNDVVSSDQWLP